MPPEMPQPTAATTPALRVLYVEDDRICATLFAALICRQTQLALRVAECGAEALEIARDWQPQALVIDKWLPDVDGVDLLAQLRALPGMAAVPAYMCSADDLPADIAAALAAGFADYWVKPVDPQRAVQLLCGRTPALP